MPPCYEFVIRGNLSPDAVPALSGFTRTVEDEFLILRGALPAGQDLSTVLAQFAALGLGLHSLRLLPEEQRKHSPVTPAG
jgi:hypothetical protein